MGYNDNAFGGRLATAAVMGVLLGLGWLTLNSLAIGERVVATPAVCGRCRESVS